MTLKEDQIPMAYAVPVDDPGLPPILTTTPDLYSVELPIGQTDIGLQIAGTPPQITTIHKTSPLASFDQVSVGQYIHGIVLPELEIVDLQDPSHLIDLIRINASNPRRLLLSPTAYFVDASIGSSAIHGAMYKHRLPESSNLGVSMSGFPPVIQFVAPSSYLMGRLHPGQTVEALLVPGQPVMNLAAGGFTSTKVEERLAATAHLLGRQLVVKDGHVPVREKGSNRPLDDCVIS